MSGYPGGRDVFRPTNTDVPPPGAYDVNSPEHPYRRYGFLRHSERFRDRPVDDYREMDDYEEQPGSSYMNSHASIAHRAPVRPRVGNTTMAMMRAEESRMRREMEHYQRMVRVQHEGNEKEMQKMVEKMNQAEERIKELSRERSELKMDLTKTVNSLNSKEREREVLAEQLEKYRNGNSFAGSRGNSRSEQLLKERAENAAAMGSKMKKALDQLKTERDKYSKRARDAESKVKKLEAKLEEYSREMQDIGDIAIYQKQISRLAEENRQIQAARKEDERKYRLEISEAREDAARYAAKLSEKNMVPESYVTEMTAKLDAAHSELSDTKAKLAKLEQIATQAADRARRSNETAQKHIDNLNAEIEHLEKERTEIQRKVNGDIKQLTSDYEFAKREFQSTVQYADDERTKRLEVSQRKVAGLSAELAKVRSVLMKKELEWKDQRSGLEADIGQAAADYQALQEKAVEQQNTFNEHIETIEAESRKQEEKWNAERSNLLTKLERAQKDGFKVRETLDELHKESDKAKSESEDRIRQLTEKLDAASTNLERQRLEWENEHKRLEEDHEAEVSALREECAELKSDAEKQRVAFETQIGEIQQDIDAVQSARSKEIEELTAKLSEANKELSIEHSRSSELEKQLAESTDAYSAEVQELEKSLAEAQEEFGEKLADMQEKMVSVVSQITGYEEVIDKERAETQKAHEEAEGLRERIHELEETYNSFEDERWMWQDKVKELEEEIDELEEEHAGDLTHYANMIAQMHTNHMEKKAFHDAEISELRDKVSRYRYRDMMHIIYGDYITELILIQHDTRESLSQEVENMRDEIWIQSQTIQEYSDMGVGLANELQTLLTLDSNETASINSLVDSVREDSHRSFIETFQRRYQADISQFELKAEISELKYMTVQGKIVETAADLRKQHKYDCTQLEVDLHNIQSNYDRFRTEASAEKSRLEARIRELEQTRVNGPQNEEMSKKNAELEEEVQRLQSEKADLEAKLDIIDYTVDAEKTDALDQQRAGYEEQVLNMNNVLAQCEADMATQVDEINELRQHISEVESEHAIMQEQLQFQIDWFRENYASAYRELEDMLESGSGGHANLKQKIKYVESLKGQILRLRKDNLEFARDRDKFKHQVGVLIDELDAYREVDTYSVRRKRAKPGIHTASRNIGSSSRMPAGGVQSTPSARIAANRRANGMRGAAIAKRVIEERKDEAQLAVRDDVGGMK